jgi:hypothetical protein
MTVEHVFEVAAAEDQPPRTVANNPFGIGVRLRRPDGCPDHPDPFVVEDLVEGALNLLSRS